MFVVKCDFGNYEAQIDYDKASDTKKIWFTLVVELRKSWKSNGKYFLQELIAGMSIEDLFKLMLPYGDKKKLSKFKSELKKVDSIIYRFLNDQGIFICQEGNGKTSRFICKSQTPISETYPKSYTGPHTPNRYGKRWDYENWCIEYTKRNWNNPRFFDLEVKYGYVKNDLGIPIADVDLLNAANGYALDLFKQKYPKEKLGHRHHIGHPTSRWEAPFASLYSACS